MRKAYVLFSPQKPPTRRLASMRVVPIKARRGGNLPWRTRGSPPRLWYGMPAYAKDGKVVCFFQSAQKFNTRYATFGFSDKANLDDGAMWPTAFALRELTAADQARIGALVKKAVS